MSFESETPWEPREPEVLIDFTLSEHELRMIFHSVKRQRRQLKFALRKDNFDPDRGGQDVMEMRLATAEGLLTRLAPILGKLRNDPAARRD